MKKNITSMVIVVGVLIAAVWWWQSHRAAPATSQSVAGAQGSSSVVSAAAVVDNHVVDANGRIMGRVVDSNKQPVRDAVIVVRRGESFDVPQTTVTAADGSFLITEVAVGIVAVTASAVDYTSTVQAGIAVKQNETTQIEFALASGGLPMSGIVRDSGGGPIAGVRIDAAADSESQTAVHASALTGVDGKYKLMAAPGTVRMTAWHFEYGVQNQTVVHQAPGSQVDFSLLPGAVVEGIVRDRASGEPVAGAMVSAQRDGQNDFARQSIGKQVRSNEAGRFRIAGLSPGNHSITARTVGRRAEQPISVGLGVAEELSGVELWLVPARTLRGIVVDDKKRPVADAFVLATSDRPEMETTDAQGVFEFATLPNGSFRIKASKGSASSAAVDVRLSDKLPEPITLTLGASQGVMLRGHVEPRGPATVSLQPFSDRIALEPAIRAAQLPVATDDQGNFELSDVSAGSWTVSAVAKNGSRGATNVDVSATGRDDIEVKLQAAASIAGRVVDGEGKPVASASVMATAQQGPVSHVIRNGAVTSGQQVMTDAKGEFIVRGLQPNTYGLRVLDHGHPLQFDGTEPKAVILASEQHVTGIVLRVKKANGVLRGIVTGPSGAPVVDAWVSARLDIRAMMSQIAGKPRSPQSTDEPSQHTETIEISDDDSDGITPVLTDSNGKFEIRGLSAGQYNITAEAQAGKLRGRASAVADGAMITVKLGALTELRGVVTHNGAPVTSYAVKISGPMQHDMEITNAQGEFRFLRVDPGAYVVDVEAAQGRGHGDIAVTQGATATLNIQLAAEGAIVGRVVDGAGQGVANLPIVVVPDRGAGDAVSITLRGPPATTAADGTFRAPASAGKMIVVVLGGGQTMRSGVVVTSGQTIDIGNLVRGTKSVQGEPPK
jgi:uncharacterized GH25 family protein